MSVQFEERQGVRIAVEGCGHGMLDSIYASIQQASRLKGWDGVDLVIICGDFQAVRNAADLNCMSVPVKYREIGDFHRYYSGDRKAPYTTLFVGGNHEASNHLFELYYGGWVAPNIYYAGAANILRFGPLRIACMSGIWKGFDYRKPHHERLPLSHDDVKSIYHIRQLDVRKLLQIRTQVDIGLSHDWPRKIEYAGDHKTLFRIKPHFEDDSRNNSLGSVAAELVLRRLRPTHWFSGHMHCKFDALLRHPQINGAHGASHTAYAVPSQADEVKVNVALDPEHQSDPKNEDEIDLDLDDDEEHQIGPPSPEKRETNSVPQELRDLLPASFAKVTPALGAIKPLDSENIHSVPEGIVNTVTRFLALDKVGPNRSFLQLISLPQGAVDTREILSAPRLMYDEEWLAITRAFASELDLGDATVKVPSDEGYERYQEKVRMEEAWVEEHIVKAGKLEIPENFVAVAPTFDPAAGAFTQEHPREYPSPQTSDYCKLLGIENKFEISEAGIDQRISAAHVVDSTTSAFRGSNEGQHQRSFNRGRTRGRRSGGRGGFSRGRFSR